MYKLAETFIKKESQWQPAVAALPPLAVGLGATSMAIGAGLTYNTLKNNPTDFKKWQTIPSATAAATGVAVKNVYDWGKDAVNSIGNSIGNFVAPKKPTISNTLPNQPGLLSNPKPLDWTNTAPSDVTSVNMFKKNKNKNKNNNTSTNGNQQAEPIAEQVPVAKDMAPSNSSIQAEQIAGRASQGGTPKPPKKDPSKFSKFIKSPWFLAPAITGMGLGTAAGLGAVGKAGYDVIKPKEKKYTPDDIKNFNLEKADTAGFYKKYGF